MIAQEYFMISRDICLLPWLDPVQPSSVDIHLLMRFQAQADFHNLPFPPKRRDEKDTNRTYFQAGKTWGLARHQE